MKIFRWLAAGLFFFSYLATAQEESAADLQRMLIDLQRDHIEANIPDLLVFDSYLARDLKAYFAAQDGGDIRVRHKLLRDGPTQTGISYPKYYAWVEVISGDKILRQGAVRVAAIDKEYFEINAFLSKSSIQQNPSAATQVFPSALLPKIYEFAEVK